jgi:uncharacterized membrane protein
MREVEEKLKALIKPGTCGGKAFYGALFFVIGLLLVNYGFWKTLLVAALTAFGVVLGSAETLGKAVGKVLDCVVPPKNQKVVYTSEDIEKVKKATQAKNEAREGAEESASQTAIQEEQA